MFCLPSAIWCQISAFLLYGEWACLRSVCKTWHNDTSLVKPWSSFLYSIPQTTCRVLPSSLCLYSKNNDASKMIRFFMFQVEQKTACQSTCSIVETIPRGHLCCRFSSRGNGSKDQIYIASARDSSGTLLSALSGKVIHQPRNTARFFTKYSLVPVKRSNAFICHSFDHPQCIYISRVSVTHHPTGWKKKLFGEWHFQVRRHKVVFPDRVVVAAHELPERPRQIILCVYSVLGDNGSIEIWVIRENNNCKPELIHTLTDALPDIASPPLTWWNELQREWILCFHPDFLFLKMQWFCVSIDPNVEIKRTNISLHIPDHAFSKMCDGCFPFPSTLLRINDLS